MNEQDAKLRSRRVFGAGRMDGLRLAGVADPEEFMNRARLQQKVAGLNGTATRVYEAIPIAEFWNANKILGELRRQGRNIDHSAVLGCLAHFVTEGLVRTQGEAFSRIDLTLPDREPPILTRHDPAAPSTRNGLASVPDAPKPSPVAATEALPPKRAPIPTPADGLAAIASNMRAQAAILRTVGQRLSDESKTMQDQATDLTARASMVEDLVLDWQANEEATTEKTAKLEKLGALLRELAP